MSLVLCDVQHPFGVRRDVEDLQLLFLPTLQRQFVVSENMYLLSVATAGFLSLEMLFGSHCDGYLMHITRGANAPGQMICKVYCSATVRLELNCYATHLPALIGRVAGGWCAR